MVYNLTNITNSTSLVEIAQSSNTILGGYYFGYFVLLIVFCVSFLSLKSKGYMAQACFSVGCWLTTITAIFLYPMGLLSTFSFWVAVLLTPIAVGILYLSDTGY